MAYTYTHEIRTMLQLITPHKDTMALTSYGFVPLLLQCRTSYAAVHTIVLLMMGIMMPETCWDKSLIINIRSVASCWFLSLHPAVYNFEYNKSFVCVCQNHIHVVTTMVAANIYAFHHGRKGILWCSVCVRQVINPCRLDSVCVSNIVLHYDYMTNL